jgi:DnaD/phage-associated family protein
MLPTSDKQPGCYLHQLAIKKINLLTFYHIHKGVNNLVKYRQVHVEFWQDGFVLDLTPEEKYFYIYLMTNSKTSQCGIYELPKRIIETETGYNRETVDKLLKRFIDYGKILYDESTKEIMLVNWVKYNAIKSGTVISCIKKELESIKNKRFIKSFYTLCIRYGYPIGTVSIDQGEEVEEEEEKEREEERELEGEEEKTFPTATTSSYLTCFDFYQQNFAMLTPHISQKMDSWLTDFNNRHEILIKAMEITLERNKRSWSYTESILKDWDSHNAKTLKDIEAFEKNKFNGRGVSSGKDPAAEQFARENGIPF